jgi:hypothetical protein
MSIDGTHPGERSCADEDSRADPLEMSSACCAFRSSSFGTVERPGPDELDVEGW